MDADLADRRQVAEGEHRVAMRGVQHLHALDHLGLGADLDGLVHHLHQHIMCLRVVGHGGELNGKDVGIQQDTRFERIEHQSGRRHAVMAG